MQAPTSRLPQSIGTPRDDASASTPRASAHEQLGENTRPGLRQPVVYPTVPTIKSLSTSPSPCSDSPKEPFPTPSTPTSPPGLWTATPLASPFSTTTANVGRRRANAISVINSPARSSHSKQMAQIFESAKISLAVQNEQSLRRRIGSEKSLLLGSPRRPPHKLGSFGRPALPTAVDERLAALTLSIEASPHHRQPVSSALLSPPLPPAPVIVSDPIRSPLVESWLQALPELPLSPATSSNGSGFPEPVEFEDKPESSSQSSTSSSSAGYANDTAYRSRLPLGPSPARRVPGSHIQSTPPSRLRIPARLLRPGLGGPTRFRASPVPLRAMPATEPRMLKAHGDGPESEDEDGETPQRPPKAHGDGPESEDEDGVGRELTPGIGQSTRFRARPVPLRTLPMTPSQLPKAHGDGPDREDGDEGRESRELTPEVTCHRRGKGKGRAKGQSRESATPKQKQKQRCGSYWDEDVLPALGPKRVVGKGKERAREAGAEFRSGSVEEKIYEGDEVRQEVEELPYC